MTNIKKIFDDDCWIIRSSLLVETSEFVIGHWCFDKGDDDDDGVFVDKDGIICGDWSEKFDGVE
jgi:hypothetical protein